MIPFYLISTSQLLNLSNFLSIMLRKLSDLLDYMILLSAWHIKIFGHSLIRVSVWQGTNLDIYLPICLPWLSYPVHVLITSLARLNLELQISLLCYGLRLFRFKLIRGYATLDASPPWEASMLNNLCWSTMPMVPFFVWMIGYLLGSILFRNIKKNFHY